MNYLWLFKSMTAALLAAGTADALLQREVAAFRQEVTARQRAALSATLEVSQILAASARHPWTPELRQLFTDSLDRQRQALVNLSESTRQLEKAQAATRPALADAGAFPPGP